MSEPETFPRHVHPEVALLPWYVNGTFADVEKQQVARHLETCEDCRAELEELSRLRSSLTAIYDAQPGQSVQTARSVLATVSKEMRGSRPASQGFSLESVDQWFRSLFMPQWIPTLVAILLVAQVGLLLWISMPPEDELITTRSVGLQTAKIAVTFQGSATEEQIRSLLQDLQGHLIDGPSRDGSYVIEVLAADASVAQRKVELLTKRTDVVRSAEIRKP